LNLEGVTFETGDRVTVEGVRADTVGVGEVLIAREIRLDDGRTLVLFDRGGNPRWKRSSQHDGNPHAGGQR
jgi:hypothetical protein